MKLHVVERFKLVEGGAAMEVNVRVEDPGAFTTVWNARQVYQKAPQGPLQEMVCAENNTNFYGYDVYPNPVAMSADF